MASAGQQDSGISNGYLDQGRRPSVLNRTEDIANNESAFDYTVDPSGIMKRAE